MTVPYTKIPPAFLNVIVVVERVPKNEGNSKCGNYRVTCNPPALTVTEYGTIINFQLIAPTPDRIKFNSIDKKKPNPTRQISDPSISLDGKQMTMWDANTLPEIICITLKFKDGKQRTSFDPQVQNDPKP